jgi:hypothetical protein
MSRGSSKLWTDEDMAKLKELLAAGADRNDIAEQMGRTVGAIYQKMWRHGLLPQSEEVWPKERIAELLRLHKLGHSRSEIGKLMGTTKNAIIAKLNRLGITETGASLTQLRYWGGKIGSQRSVVARRKRKQLEMSE